MAEGFLAQKPRSPTSMIVIIAAHAAVLTALALSKMEVTTEVFPIFKARNIPLDRPPPENPPEAKEKAKLPPETKIDYVPPSVPSLPNDTQVALDQQPNVQFFDPGPSGETDTAADPPKPLPLPDPIRIAARMDSRSELQPPYPASEQRMGEEGTVVVRLTIGADGRVKAVERVSAASDAFWRATERHALRHWRFKPATVDGRPVESRQTVTVHFRMDA